MNNNSFFSIDRLLEFGMGMAVSRQMVDIMNRSFQEMYIPGSIQSMPTVTSISVYVAINGKQAGPLSQSELMTLISKGDVNKDSLAWIAGMSAWRPIEEIPEILKFIALSPPPLNL